MSVSLADSDPCRAESPRALFETGLEPSQAFDQYAVAPDGERFLFRLPDRGTRESGSPIHVLVDWASTKRP